VELIGALMEVHALTLGSPRQVQVAHERGTRICRATSAALALRPIRAIGFGPVGVVSARVMIKVSPHHTVSR